MITVVNKRAHKYTHYIGRGSVFGNPFHCSPLPKAGDVVHVNTVEDACAQFKAWAKGTVLRSHVEPERRVKLLHAIASLPDDAVLGCYCDDPAKCRGTTIIALRDDIKAGRVTVPKPKPPAGMDTGRMSFTIIVTLPCGVEVPRDPDFDLTVHELTCEECRTARKERRTPTLHFKEEHE